MRCYWESKDVKRYLTALTQAAEQLWVWWRQSCFCSLLPPPPPHVVCIPIIYSKILILLTQLFLEDFSQESAQFCDRVYKRMINFWYPKWVLSVPHPIRWSWLDGHESLHKSFAHQVPIACSYLVPFTHYFKHEVLSTFTYCIHAYTPQFTLDFAFKVLKRSSSAHHWHLQIGIYLAHSSHELPLKTSSKYLQPAFFIRYSISDMHYFANFYEHRISTFKLEPTKGIQVKKGSCNKTPFSELGPPTALSCCSSQGYQVPCATRSRVV